MSELMKICKPLFIIGALTLPFTGIAQRNKNVPPSTTGEDKTVYYDMIRNAPSRSGLFGVIVNPVYVDINNLNLNIGGGAEFFCTYQSKLRLSGGYHFAYGDHLTGENTKAPESSSISEYGTAVNTNKSFNYNVMVSPTLYSWEKESNYHITLGSAGYRTVAVTRVHGKVMKALTGRFGYQVDERIIQNESGLPFKNTTPPYVYHNEGQTYTFTPENLATSSSRIRAEMAVVGFAYTSFRDVKITLDDSQYKGRREEKAQHDLYVDLLYAHKLSLQDMVYYHTLYYATQEYRQIPQRLNLTTTKLNKTGVRAGYQVITMYKPNFGTKFLLEAGIRPGIKSEGKNGNKYVQFSVGFIFGGRAAIEQKNDE
jgi:hypothetical protein